MGFRIFMLIVVLLISWRDDSYRDCIEEKL